MSILKSVTYKTTPNIALVKYWGKRNRELNLPINSSLSITLADFGLNTTTTVSISDAYEQDVLMFNGIKKSLSDDKKIGSVVNRFRHILQNKDVNDIEKHVKYEQLAKCPIHIETKNSFPTAAGMASSASGLACLTKALSELYNVVNTKEEEAQLNAITRQASGSACRSLYGGLVRWNKGIKSDGSDSISHPIFDETYWPELQVGICIVSESVKDVSSTEGMIRCLQTSPKMKIRETSIVDERIDKAIEAYSKHDFASLAEIIMKDSDTLHEICKEAIPSIHYLSKQSYYIINLVHTMNTFFKRNLVIAYSFDAGSNAFLFYEKQDENSILPILSALLKPTVSSISINTTNSPLVDSFLSSWSEEPININQFISTHVGCGPTQIVSFVCLKKKRVLLETN